MIQTFQELSLVFLLIIYISDLPISYPRVSLERRTFSVFPTSYSKFIIYLLMLVRCTILSECFGFHYELFWSPLNDID